MLTDGWTDRLTDGLESGCLYRTLLQAGAIKNVDKAPRGAHKFQASTIPSNGYIFSTDFSYYTAQ